MMRFDDEARYIPFEFYGPMGVPGHTDVLLLLIWEERHRIIPIWVPPEVEDVLTARYEGETPRRPDWPDMTWDLLDSLGDSIAEVRIDSCHEGVFTAHLLLSSGVCVDIRPVMGLILSVIRPIPILVREDVVHQASLWISPEQALEYLDLELPALPKRRAEGESASGDNLADAEFAQFMAELGADEQEIFATGAADSDGSAGSNAGAFDSALSADTELGVLFESLEGLGDFEDLGDLEPADPRPDTPDTDDTPDDSGVDKAHDDEDDA
ncbi:MAG: DUF151 domain-containing protein [Corynebacterium sp.]|nr:DUF151 domain-containing protein [Corynebacterium sp.]